MFALPMEPYAMIQMSILLSVINLLNSGIGTRTQNCGCEFHSRQFQSVLAEPLAATRGTLVEKH